MNLQNRTEGGDGHPVLKVHDEHLIDLFSGRLIRVFP